jgi:alkylation response protein AidB-like acyl-CoA dehydrogenase
LNGDSHLSEKGIALRKKTRELMTSLEKPLETYINKTEFPFELVPKLKELGINGYHIKDFGGPGLNSIEVGALCFELAKVDASIFTFLTVHNSIGMAVVDILGNEEQRARILPDGIAFKKILSFGLTEPDYGSDATSLKTTAKKVEGGYLLNGVKRWIGNATFADYIIVWAVNIDAGNKIQGFLVEKGSKGLSTKKIENKYALRMVQNADVFMDNVFVPEHNKLAKADDFATGTNKILEHSRIKVCWGAVGIAAGAYEAALKYTLERKQFGRPVASFQLSQLKLSKMLAMVESMLSMVFTLSTLYDQGKTSIGQIGRTKSHCT